MSLLGDDVCVLRNNNLLDCYRAVFANKNIRAFTNLINNQIDFDGKQIHSIRSGLEFVCAVVGDDKETVCKSNYIPSNPLDLRGGGGFNMSIVKPMDEYYVVKVDETRVSNVSKLDVAERIGCVIETVGLNNKLYCWGTELSGYQGKHYV